MHKTIKKLNLALPVLCLAMALPINQAKAAVAIPPQPTVFDVTTTVASACTVTATNLTFNNYTGIQLDGQTSLSVTCSNGTNYSIELDNGLAGGNNPNQRRMVFGANELDYDLYKDLARTQIWGGGADSLSGLTGIGAAQSFPVYGRIPGGQTVPAGNYSDTITVTLVVAP